MAVQEIVLVVEVVVQVLHYQVVQAATQVLTQGQWELLEVAVVAEAHLKINI
jgi:hypothetical protein